MHDFSDQELDRLSREAAENYDASSPSLSWEQFRHELDKAMPAKEKNRRRFFWLFLLALIFIGGSTYYFWQNSGKKSASGSGTIASNPAATQNETNKPGDITKDGSGQGAAKEALPSSKNSGSEAGNAEAEQRNAKGSSGTTGNENAIVNSKQNSESGTADLSAPTRNKKLPGNGSALVATRSSRSNPGKNSVPAGKKSNQKNQPLDLAQGFIASSADFSAERLNIESGKNFSSPLLQPAQMVRERPKPANTAADSKPLPKRSSFTQPQRGPEISAVYAPDWSNIKFTGSGEVGFNVGVLLGYNFSSRWSIESGLIFTKKNYASSGENFKFPPNYYYGRLVNAEGYCKMFDIPINVRYNAIATNKQKFFISAGLSSYLMSKEHYKFNCTRNGNYWPSWYTNENNSSYLLSIANLSFGYEYALNKNFSLLGEPYFKLALNDIGTGNVRLNSMGMYIGIKYKPAFIKPKTDSKK